MELEVTVEKPVDVSNEEAAKWLKDAFAAYLDTAPENVRVRLIVTASVKVTIELSARAAESLLAACQSNDPNLARHLEPLVLVSIQRLRTIPELPWFRWALVSALASATYFALASATYFALVVAVYWVVGGGRWGEFIAIWACLWPLAAAVILARDTDQWLLRVVMVFFAVLFCVMCVLWFGSVVAALFTGVALSAIVLVVTVRMTS